MVEKIGLEKNFLNKQEFEEKEKEINEEEKINENNNIVETTIKIPEVLLRLFLSSCTFRKHDPGRVIQDYITNYIIETKGMLDKCFEINEKTKQEDI